MARRRRGKPVNGWVSVDKPTGVTSTQVVGKVRRTFDAATAGHAGTLDPIASGVLPVALGEATKTVPYLMDADKTYRFTIRWGEARDTDDIEGEVIETSDRRPTAAEVEAALPAFLGEIEQLPPRFSAVKIGGQRAYDLARGGEVVEMRPRIVRVDRFALTAMPDPDHAEFEVGCGKGTYMRALARDLARAVGTVGHVAALRRTRVGPFTEEHAIPLDSLEALTHSPAAFEHLLPVATALDDIPALALSGTEASRLRLGQSVPIFRRSDLERIGELREGDLLCATERGQPVAVARIAGGCLCPERVFNL